MDNNCAEACADPSTEIGELKNSGYFKCKCKGELVLVNGRCSDCEEGCLYCENKVCKFCDSDMWMDKSEGVECV